MDLISYILNKNAIAKVEVDVEEVKEDLSKAEQDIVDIKEDISDIKEDIAQDEQDISDIKGDISTIQGDITDIKEDIIQDEQDISDIKGDIATIQNDISDINTELAKKVDEDDLGSSAYLNAPEEGHDAAAGEVVVGSDSRLSDSRDPNPHTHTLANITDAGSAAAYDIPVMGDALADEVVMGDDSRLTDTRDPNPHTHDLSDITDAGTAASKNVAASGDASTTEVVMGNDSRLTDDRDPNPHTHEVADITDFPSLGTASAKNVPSSGDAGNDEVVLGNDSRLSDARPSSDVTNTYSSSGTVPVSGKAVAAALGTLDVSSVGGNNKYISEISETDGKISATAGTIDTTVTKDSTNIVTSGAVWAAIDDLPEPMVFRGSLGSGGTISVLPIDGSATVGDTYKVITDGTYAGQDAKVGDLFSCLTRTSSANTWEYFPSGDEPSGTVISVKIEASSPIVVDDDSAITTSGTRVLSHANSGVTAGTYTSVTVDAKGHVTNGSNPDISYNDLVDKPTLGTAAALDVASNGDASNSQVVKGNDSRLTNARPSSDVTDTYSASGTVPVSGKAVASAIGGLDVTGASSIDAGKTIKSWSETDGKVSITTQDIAIANTQVSGLGSAATKDTTDTYSATGTNPTTGKAVAAALGTLDVTGASNIGASKTISAWSETDGKVSISTQNIAIANTQVSGLGTAATKNTTDTYSSTGTDPTTGKAVAAALGTLDVTGASGIAASKTIKAWSETDGKVSITTQDISITKSQVSDFPTLGTAAAKDVPASGNASTSQVVMGNDTRLSDSRNAKDVYSWAKASTKPSYTASEVGALADTTKYAGSSSVGGAATSAAKLNNTSKIGDTNKPVYFTADGVPAAISYTIKTSVPEDAVFTDKKVTTSEIAVTSHTTYYPALVTADTNQTPVRDGGLSYRASKGTTSAEGLSRIVLGNATATGTAGNQKGVLYLYSASSYYASLTPGSFTASRGFTLPDKAGTIALTNDIPTNVSDLTNDSGFVTTDEQVTSEAKNPSSDTSYGILFAANATNQKPYYNDGITYRTKEGTTSAPGVARLILGNSKTSTTDKNKRGTILLYGDTGKYANIVPGSNSSDITLTLPTSTGTVALTSDLTEKLDKSGDTMTGRLTMGGKPISQIITGTGTVGQDKGSGQTNRYVPSEWKFNTGVTVTDGDIFTIKIPVAGISYGVWVSMDNGTTYYPVAINGTTRLGTHYGVNSYLTLQYENAGSVSVYARGGSDSSSTVTKIFRVLNFYNSDTNTILRVYRQNTGYNADYPLIASRTLASSIGTAGTNSSYTGVYGLIWDDTTKIPTVNPSTGLIKAVKITTDISTCTGLTKSQVTTALGYTPPASDTNNAVTQTATTTDANYEVLFSATADNTTRTEGARKTTTLRFNPSKGALMEGNSTTASGTNSHAEGNSTVAQGNNSHAEGKLTTAAQPDSHTEGYGAYTDGNGAHAEGMYTCAAGTYSHAEGSYSTSKGNQSHAEGCKTYAAENYSHTEGYYTCASGNGAHAEGYSATSTRNIVASGAGAHAEGTIVCINNVYEGNIIASGMGSHAEGGSTTASGTVSHAEGGLTIASGNYSHAEGWKTTAKGGHAEGFLTYASGNYSHAEGNKTTAYGSYTHAEGYQTSAYSECHAEGYQTTCQGNRGAHTEGCNTKVLGTNMYSGHAEGYYTTVSGDYGAHAGGQNTCAAGASQTVIGKHNIPNTTDAFIIGGGSGSGANRKNIFSVDWDGNIKANGVDTTIVKATSTDHLTEFTCYKMGGLYHIYVASSQPSKAVNTAYGNWFYTSLTISIPTAVQDFIGNKTAFGVAGSAVKSSSGLHTISFHSITKTSIGFFLCSAKSESLKDYHVYFHYYYLD